MTGTASKLLAAAAVLMGLATGAAAAEDTLKLAVGQRGNWDSSVPELGQRAGIFQKHGLALEILYTQGGGETLQAVISASADIGVQVGTMGALGVFAKGAPVRAIGSASVGANDAYWYVRADSPVRSMKDAEGRTVAYSTRGSSTHLIALGLLKQHGVEAEPVATGNSAATFTQVMSGQVDIGWSSPPFGLEALQRGEIRMVARGLDVPSFRDQSIRLLVANAAALEERRPVLARFMQAYRETLDWMYADPAALRAYAAFVELPEPLVTRARDDFYPEAALFPDRLAGLEGVMSDGIAFDYLPAPLTAEQLETFAQLLPAAR